MNYSKPRSNDSNKNAILILLFLSSSLFHLLMKQKPDVRVKIIPLAIFFFIGSSVKHLQRPTPHDGINAADHILLPLNKFESLYTSYLHSQSVFLSVSKLIYRNSNSYYRLLLLRLGDISLNPDLFITSGH